jgi:hydroxypyruvate isomerase
MVALISFGIVNNMPRFAANLGFLFPEHDFLDRFAAAHRAGFRAVEFAAPYPYEPALLAEKLRENDLECILLNLPMGDKAKGDFGIANRPERRDEFRDGVARAITYAHALGCPKMNCIPGTIKPGEERAGLRATLVDNLRLAAREFKAAKLDLVIEPLNTYDVPTAFVSRSPEAVEIIREVGADNLGLQCDLYHTAMMGDDPVAILRSLRGSIRHIQFADAPGRGEPGTGKLDMPKLFAAVDAIGYGGWLSAEYNPTRATPETLSWFLR